MLSVEVDCVLKCMGVLVALAMLYLVGLVERSLETSAKRACAGYACKERLCKLIVHLETIRALLDVSQGTIVKSGWRNFQQCPDTKVRKACEVVQSRRGELMQTVIPKIESFISIFNRTSEDDKAWIARFRLAVSRMENDYKKFWERVKQLKMHAVPAAAPIKATPQATTTTTTTTTTTSTQAKKVKTKKTAKKSSGNKTTPSSTTTPTTTPTGSKTTPSTGNKTVGNKIGSSTAGIKSTPSNKAGTPSTTSMGNKTTTSIGNRIASSTAGIRTTTAGNKTTVSTANAVMKRSSAATIPTTDMKPTSMKTNLAASTFTATATATEMNNLAASIAPTATRCSTATEMTINLAASTSTTATSMKTNLAASTFTATATATEMTNLAASIAPTATPSTTTAAAINRVTSTATANDDDDDASMYEKLGMAIWEKWELLSLLRQLLLKVHDEILAGGYKNYEFVPKASLCRARGRRSVLMMEALKLKRELLATLDANDIRVSWVNELSTALFVDDWKQFFCQLETLPTYETEEVTKQLPMKDAKLEALIIWQNSVASTPSFMMPARLAC